MAAIKCIGILTSGGDAPGMNAAIRAVTRTAIYNGFTVKGILRGYRGLVTNEIVDFHSSSVSNIIQLGGTILKGRRQNSKRISQKLGISMQEEEEFVVIVTPREKKAAVMNAISDACGLRTDAHGIILSLPVDEVIGLETGENTL